MKAHPEEIGAVLFDFNGVIVDDERIHMELLQQVLAGRGITISEEEYFEIYLGFDDRGCFREAFRASGRPLDDVMLAALIDEKAALYTERARKGIPLFPGAAKLIHECAKRWPLAIVSGALEDEITGALSTAGLRDLFPIIIAAQQVSEGKPSPEGFQKALSKISGLPRQADRSLDPSSCAAIEDSPAGITAARKAGMRTIGVAHSYPREKLAEADSVVDRIGDIRPGLIASLAR